MKKELAQPPIIDTHVHLDEPDFDSDRLEVLKASRDAGIRRFVNIGYKPERWMSSHALHEAHDDIDMVLGLHPLEASRFDAALERDLREALQDGGAIGVGETGFDFSRSAPSFAVQERAFHAQMRIAEEMNLPIIIHQRAASHALMAALDACPDVSRIVLHSFDGDRRFADWAIARGCFIGVGGLALKKALSSLRAILGSVPTDRLLLETDAPYLVPPNSDDRRNSPENLPTIARLLAPYLSLPPDELCRATTANAETLFPSRGTHPYVE